MTDALHERLNKVLPRVISDDFLSGSGIGNEIAFYIFDYPPEDELRVREHIRFLLERIPKQKPALRFKHVNLFDLVLDYLKRRKLLEKVVLKQRNEGNEALKKALAGPLHPEKLVPFFCEVVQPRQQELVLVSGVGSVYPLVRTSSLLSNLQGVMGSTPLVMFYPGKYDQLTLCLFGKLSLSAFFEGGVKARKSEHYYRAFKLVP
jgi:Domain of unknown function (DUF1788)